MDERLNKMDEQMQVRGLAAGTRQSYLRPVRKFGEHFDTGPGELGLEHVERFLLHLCREAAYQASTRNVYASALRFFFPIACRPRAAPTHLDSSAFREPRAARPVDVSLRGRASRNALYSTKSKLEELPAHRNPGRASRFGRWIQGVPSSATTCAATALS